MPYPGSNDGCARDKTGRSLDLHLEIDRLAEEHLGVTVPSSTLSPLGRVSLSRMSSGRTEITTFIPGSSASTARTFSLPTSEATR